MSTFPTAPEVWGAKMFSIWRDIILTTEGTACENLDTADFEVFADLGPGVSTLSIMSGRATKRPGDSFIAVRVNDIIAGYVQTQMDFSRVTGAGDYSGRWGEGYENQSYDVVNNGGILRLGQTAPDMALKFGITWREPGTTGAGDTESFVVLNNRSYKHDGWDFMSPQYQDLGTFNPILNDHICTIIDERQILFLSVSAACGPQLLGGTPRQNVPQPVWWIHGYGADSTQADFEALNSEVGSVPHHFFLFPYKLQDSNPDGGEASRLYQFDVSYMLPGESYRSRARYPNVGAWNYSPEGMKQALRVRRTCAKYVLYYVNALGGIDSIVTTGLYKKSASVTRSQIVRAPFFSEMNLRRNPRNERGRDVVALTATESLELHTPWLNDVEAAKIHHLLNSPNVWVHDVEASWAMTSPTGDIVNPENAIFPAVLTDSSFEEKSYRNQGHRLVSYTIHLDLATDIIRR